VDVGLKPRERLRREERLGRGGEPVDVGLCERERQRDEAASSTQEAVRRDSALPTAGLTIVD
jgi:hypothetical protein